MLNFTKGRRFNNYGWNNGGSLHRGTFENMYDGATSGTSILVVQGTLWMLNFNGRLSSLATKWWVPQPEPHGNLADPGILAATRVKSQPSGNAVADLRLCLWGEREAGGWLQVGKALMKFIAAYCVQCPLAPSIGVHIMGAIVCQLTNA